MKTVLQFEKPDNSEKIFFVIQIGAFSSLERADVFARNSESKLNRRVKVNLNEEMNLYVVQLAELFTNKADAERVRANLWQLDEYSDAWIILVRDNKTIR